MLKFRFTKIQFLRIKLYCEKYPDLDTFSIINDVFRVGRPLFAHGATLVVLNQAEETYANIPKIKLNHESSVDLFSIVGNPSNGTLSSINSTTGVITYIAETGFIGKDIFKFNATAGNQTSPPALVTLSVIPEPIMLKDSPGLGVGLAFGLSLVIVFLIFLVVFLIVKK